MFSPCQEIPGCSAEEEANRQAALAEQLPVWRANFSNEEITYAAYALEAALFGPQWATIPLLTEFCETPAGEKVLFAKTDGNGALASLLVNAARHDQGFQ
ncbi:hypothetical protein [Neomoorella thermoacetica]|uniref:Uncharacterized protein n=2 Tax=Neomoorella thermoacetica TaxID=1525 RepID=A0A1J5K0W0_NEOTH|nr:hypothetical protein [Moorella thermoacetica]OIQ07672.1 hypothetical protein MOOR_27270 [Moorella thermoacetica]OIQ10447.1 hypothetical protein MOOTH_26640 [Moorella thermoacetica]GAF25266.1 phosphoribosylaminoimidazole (AIR) synthetase [Moorella thermoacetica Y72]